MEIATKQAENDVDLRAVMEAGRVAKADVRRARQSIERFPNSISQSELEHLELAVTQSELQVERIRLELDIAKATQRLRETDYEIASSKLKRHQIAAPIGAIAYLYLRFVRS